MASSSSSSPRNWRYNVFTSFHGPDTRIKFLSHLRQQFNYNGTTMFDDNGIERSQIIAPALTKAIKESRIAIVLLSKNYASSSWCLDELLEILKCKEEKGQIVMTVFYEVDPSHVRKQTGDFGRAFNKTCDGKTEEKIKNWSQALTYVGNIAGEHFQNWDNEAKMIEKISSDVSHKLNDTPSRDFDGMVGLEGHLRKMESLLDLAYDGAKIVGISGPAGIGKSTIARALHSRFSNRFQHTCFMDNLRENYKSGLAEYGLKVRLHEQFLSNILNLNGIRISHLGVIKDRLQDKKVLIILDDVEHLDQLETLANIEWFGPGSRVIVTTENKEILQQHGIIDVYPVGFPSGREALMIFCLSAFRQTYPPVEFMNLADEVARICGKLPLGLHVLGSSLRGKSQADWIDELPRLKNCLDGRIESVLKVGYESLHENDQTLFLLIAIFFNHAHVDHVTSMLTKNNLVFRLGLKTLVNRYLVHHENSKVVMHHLLQVMARQIISKQEPWKRQILIDAQEICYLLENAEGNNSTVGISFDVAEIDELILSVRAFERMRNLLFLKVYDWWHNGKSKLHIPEEMEFLPCLRLLSWDAYPRKSLPRSFCPKNLVELHMPDSQLEKLWEGTQLLANLKTMKLSRSSRLKELPDLSNATNLERLDLYRCVSLVELPSSISSLHKLHFLETNSCRSLEVIPTLTNLGSLEDIKMMGCLRLRNFPEIPTNIITLSVMETTLEECPASLRHLSLLKSFDISGSVNLKTFQTYLPTSITDILLSNSGIESITDCIKGLHNLRVLALSNCKKLKSLPELPGSLECLRGNNCESLERVSVPLNTPNAQLDFSNGFKLGRQARRAIIQQLFVGGWALLPGNKVPIEFDHRARGNLLTIPHSVFYRYKVGVVISTEYDHQARDSTIVSRLLCRCINTVTSTNMKFVLSDVSKNRAEHLLIFHASLPFIKPSEVSPKIVFEFSSIHNDFDIIECGVQILTDETERNNNGGCGDGNDHWDTHESDGSPDNVAQSESEEAFDKEDYEEGYKSESGEASKDKDEDMADDDNYESVSRKRPRKTMMITSATTNMKSFIQRRRLKRKVNHKSSLYSRSFRIALLELRSRRKPTPSEHS